MGEIFEEYSEKNRADLPPLTIIQGGGTVYRDESNRNLQFDKNSLSNYKAVNPDDFIVHLRSFEGGLEKATYCGLISPAYHTFHGDGIDSDFYYLYFRSKRFIDTDLKPHVYGIRDGRSIDIDGMKTISIPWTTVNEQRAIGGFYNSLDSSITLHQRMCSIFCFCAFGSRTNFNQSSKDSFGYYATSVPCRRCARCHRRWLQAPLTSPRRLRFRFFLRWRFDRLASARKNSIISLMGCRSGSLSSPLRGSVACVSRVLDSGGGARLPCRISGAVGLRANHEEWRRARKSRRQT